MEQGGRVRASDLPQGHALRRHYLYRSRRPQTADPFRGRLIGARRRDVRSPRPALGPKAGARTGENRIFRCSRAISRLSSAARPLASIAGMAWRAGVSIALRSKASKRTIFWQGYSEFGHGLYRRRCGTRETFCDHCNDAESAPQPQKRWPQYHHIAVGEPDFDTPGSYQESGGIAAIDAGRNQISPCSTASPELQGERSRDKFKRENGLDISGADDGTVSAAPSKSCSTPDGHARSR